MKLVGYGNQLSKLITSILKSSKPISFEKFEDVFINLKNKVIDYGLIPIENNLGGSLHVNYDLLLKYDFKIIEEYNYPINHCLICLPKSNIKNINTVTSHYQVLYQCANFIKNNKYESLENYILGNRIFI